MGSSVCLTLCNAGHRGITPVQDWQSCVQIRLINPRVTAVHLLRAATSTAPFSALQGIRRPATTRPIHTSHLPFFALSAFATAAVTTSPFCHFHHDCRRRCRRLVLRHRCFRCRPSLQNPHHRRRVAWWARRLIAADGSRVDQVLKCEIPVCCVRW